MKHLASLAGLDLTQLVNTKSKAFKDSGMDAQQFTNEDAGRLLVEKPKAMHRPLLTDEKNLVVGFKPEEMEEIL